MEKMFIYVLDQAVTVSVVILAVILARFLLRRAPRWIVCALWAAVAIRLLVPVSIESPFSLVPDVQSVQTRIEAAYVQNSGNSAENAVADKTHAETISHEKMDNAKTDRNTKASESESRKRLGIRGTEIVWLIGIGALFLYAFSSYLRMRRKVAAAYRIESGVYVCDEVASPFILGMFRPRIYLPSGMDEDFRECVIAHERAHLMRRDHLWKPLGYLLLAIYWFHPLCWIAYVLFCKDIEVACDERATRSRTNDWKATYCQALLFAGSGKRRIAVSPVAFGEISVRERVKGIINYKKPKPWGWFLAAAVVVVILVCFMTNPGKSGHPKDAQTLAEFGFSVESLDTENGILRLRDDLTDEVYSFGLLGTNENFDDTTGNLVDREDYVQTDPTIYQSRQAYLVRFGRKDGVIWLESGSGRNSDLALCAWYDLQEDSAGEADAYIYLFKTNAD